jgi:hypothetical protein
MKKATLALVLLVLGAIASEPAIAHGRARVFVGFNFGVPVYGPYWHPWYPAYYPAPVYYPTPAYYPVQSPPVYVERNDVAPAPAPAQPAGDWYYCAETRGYYPYVQQCAGGWQRVPPSPPPARP